MKRTKCCRSFFWISWDIFVILLWDILKTYFCEIFWWDVNVKKLSHNPSSYQLPRGEQGEKNKMLSPFFLKFMRYFCEIFLWDILETYFCEIFWWDVNVKKLSHNPSFYQLHRGEQGEKNKMLSSFFWISWDIFVIFRCASISWIGYESGVIIFSWDIGSKSLQDLQANRPSIILTNRP